MWILAKIKHLCFASYHKLLLVNMILHGFLSNPLFCLYFWNEHWLKHTHLCHWAISFILMFDLSESCSEEELFLLHESSQIVMMIFCAYFPPVAKVAIEEKVETKKVEMKEETPYKGTWEQTKDHQIIFIVVALVKLNVFNLYRSSVHMCEHHILYYNTKVVNST